MTGAVRVLKTLQLAVAAIAIVVSWVIYPGVLVLFATIVGACYMVAALLALADKRIAIWTATLFTTLAAVLSTLAIGRFQRAGFSFLSGSYESHSQFYAVPYLFLLMSIGSLLAVVLYAVCWRWLIFGRRGSSGRAHAGVTGSA
jgi:hypothetical protein